MNMNWELDNSLEGFVLLRETKEDNSGKVYVTLDRIFNKKDPVKLMKDLIGPGAKIVDRSYNGDHVMAWSTGGRDTYLLLEVGDRWFK